MDNKSGTTYRDHLEALAKQGDQNSIDKLNRVFEYSSDYEYLIEWTYELIGRSGAGFGVVAPLTYPVIESWARLRDIRLEPYEVRALIELENALRNPGKEEEDDLPEAEVTEAENKVIELRPRGQWPKRRREPEIARGE